MGYGAGMTSVAGYAAKEVCEAAGAAFVDDGWGHDAQWPQGSSQRFTCLPGPSRSAGPGGDG